MSMAVCVKFKFKPCNICNFIKGPFLDFLSQCVALLHQPRLVCISSKIFYKTNTASDMKKKSSSSFVNNQLTKCKQIFLAAVIRMMPLP